MSTVAVVANPRSRQHRRNPGLTNALAYVLGEKGEIVSPTDLRALAATTERFRERGVDLVCVNGGDGTIHQVLTALVRTYGEASALPRIAVLRGGTMNIVADSVGVRGSAEETLGRVIDAIHTGGELQTTTRRLMRIEVDDQPPYYGFLSGNGIIARFLELYYEHPDPSPISASWLLARGAASALVRGSLAQRLTRPYLGKVVIDGHPLPSERWMAVAFGTVEQMGLGFRVFHLLRERPEALQVVAIGSSIANLARELPSVYRGGGVRRPGNSTAAAGAVELESDEPIPLMIDGDFVRADRGRVRYSVGPEISFVIG